MLIIWASQQWGASSPPVETFRRITEDDEIRITEDDDVRITEDG